MDYKTSDLGKLLGVTANTIRRYEKNGYVYPKRDEAGYRWYRENDIFKIAIIRLYRRYGFSHNEIENMMGESIDGTINIFKERLYNTEEEIKRLENIKGWLDNSIKSMEVERNGFEIRQCGGFRYVFFSDGEVFLKENGRLETINNFMYKAPKVYMVQLWLLDDILEERLVPPHNGWAVDEDEIIKFESEIIKDNRYVLKYEACKCVFGVMKKSPKNFDPTGKHAKIANEFFKKAFAYMNERALVPVGNPIGVVENSLSENAGIFVYIPVKSKNQ